MIFKRNVYAIFLDEFFIGISEDDGYIWDIAQNHANGTQNPLTDDNFADRIQYNTISPNKYSVDGKNAYDKTSNDSFLCANNIIAQELADKLNELYLIKEKEEAKIRAMAL